MGLQMLLPALLLTIIAAVSCHGAEAYDYGYAQACTAAQYMPLSGSTNNNCQQLQPALSELVLCRNARIVNLFDHTDIRHRVHFYDLLMDNPRGRPSPPTPAGCPGVSPDTPYTTWTCTGNNIGATCTATCDYCGHAPTAVCDASGWVVSNPAGCFASNQCVLACFAGSSKVVVQGQPRPVAIEDVRVGDHVRCFEAGTDLTSPGQATWCEVVNWARADPAEFDDLVRINFASLTGGTAQSIIVSGLHLVSKTAGPQGGNIQTCLAKDVQAGDYLPTAGADGSITAAVVKSVEFLRASGKYLPALQHPFILVDGAVMPLWSSWADIEYADSAATSHTDKQHVSNAFRHMLMSPLWMTRMQPEGTPGRLASWGGDSMAPLLRALGGASVADAVVPVSGAANFTRTVEWFMPRYRAYQADAKASITPADVLIAWPQLFENRATAAALDLPAQGSVQAISTLKVAAQDDGWMTRASTAHLLVGSYELLA